MDNQNQKYPWTSIRNLLVVLFSGIFLAVIFSLFMLYHYGPTGRYLLANTLLSPETIATLSYKDPHARKGKFSILQFDHIEYSRWDAEKKQWQSVQLTPEEFGQLYHKIADDKSILDVSNEIVNQFYSSPSSKLTIFVKTQNVNGSVENQIQPFQVAEFSNEGNYYRIDLRGKEGSGEWTYFYHPKIQQEAFELFSPTLQGIK